MTKNKFTFIVVEIGTILAIFCFAYLFRESFFGTPASAADSVRVPDTQPVLPGPRGFAKPAKLSIPSVSINAKVQLVGFTSDGSMGIPTNFTDAGWYKYGTIPGEVGSAVMAGHVDNALGLKGVFKHLHKLNPGDGVYITDEKGKTIHFKVRNVKTYAYDAVPEEEIFHESKRTLIRLITCGGKWIRSAKTYDERVIVTAEYIP